MTATNSPAIEIRSAAGRDAAQICEIYNHYIKTSTITFEEESVTASDMCQRIRDVEDAGLPWLVACQGESVMGFAYANKWKVRAAYRNSVEVTIYIRDGLGRSGVGTRLYTSLLAALKERKRHAIIGGIALPNEASIRLHQKLGFEKVAHFKEVGFKFGRWVDVTYWQLLLSSEIAR